MNSASQASASDTLNGWKDIASHLGRSVRSVQRWESELGLPVRRIRGTDGQTVYALRSELDEWVRSRDLPKQLPDDIDESDQVQVQTNDPSNTQHSVGPGAIAMRAWPGWMVRMLSVVVAIGLGFAAGRYFGVVAPGPMAQLQASGTQLVAYDALGRVAWTHSFGEQISHPDNVGAIPNNGVFADANGDGKTEALFALRFSQNSNAAEKSDVLYSFDAGGRIKWSYSPNFTFACGKETFTGPWRIYSMAVTTHPGPRHLLLGVNHQTWWPGLVIDVDPDGKAELKYMQTGWVRDVREWSTPSGTYVTVAGVDNERERPTLALLSASQEPAMAPHETSRFTCAGAPTGSAQAVYEFPNSESPTLSYQMSGHITVLDGGLKLNLNADYGSNVVEISQDLNVKTITPSDGFWAWHRTQEAQGLLHHTAENCPEATMPRTVKIWNPGRGWSQVAVMARDRTTSTHSVSLASAPRHSK